MMLRTGSKGFTPLEKVADFSRILLPHKAGAGSQPETDPPQAEKPSSASTVRERNSLTGFTLVEVMVATAALSLGTLFIYESFFRTIDSYNYCANYFNVAYWVDEKVWQVQDTVTRLGPEAVETSGVFTNKNEDFAWGVSYSLRDEDETTQLYRINVMLSWKEGQRRRQLLRTAYARYAKK